MQALPAGTSSSNFAHVSKWSHKLMGLWSASENCMETLQVAISDLSSIAIWHRCHKEQTIGFQIEIQIVVSKLVMPKGPRFPGCDAQACTGSDVGGHERMGQTG